MPIFIRLLLALSRFLWVIWLWLLFVALFTLLLAVLLFPRLSHYHLEIEQWLSVVLQQPVAISAVTTYWSDWMPTVALHHVQLSERNSKSPNPRAVAQFAYIEVSFNVLASVAKAQLITGSIALTGIELTLSHPSHNKIILVGSSPEATTPSKSTEVFSEWLLGQPSISLHFSRLTWLEPQIKPLNFNNLKFSILQQGRARRLAVTSFLPMVKPFQGGLVTFEGKTQWDGLQLSQLNGQFALEQIASLPKLSGRIYAQLEPAQDKNAWRIELKNVLIGNKSQQTLLDQIVLRPSLTTKGLQNLTATIQSVELNDLIFWTGEILGKTEPNVKKTMADLAIEGKLEQIELNYTAKEWSLEARLTQFKTQNTAQLPGIKGLSAELKISPTQGYLNFKQTQFSLYYPSFYSKPFLLRLKGKVNYQLTDNQWLFFSDQLELQDDKTQVNLVGTFTVPTKTGSPSSDLTAQLSNLPLATVYQYIPEKQLPDLSNWLKQALVAGTVQSAIATLKGNPSTWFDNKKNNFKFKAIVNNTQLNYTSGWPGIRDLKAEVAIEGRGLTIAAQHGQILDTQLQQVTANIPDLASDEAIVNIDGTTKGNSTDGLRFVQQSPLKQTVDLGNLALKGAMVLNLKLSIPLSKGSNTVAGKINLENNELKDDSLDIRLTKVGGVIHFDDETLTADAMKGKLFDSPIHFSIHTIKQRRSKSTRVQLSGQADRQFIYDQLTHLNPDFAELPVYDYLSGQTDWNVILDLPEEKNKEASTKLQLQSDLVGLNIDLPEPLGKKAKQTRSLNLEIKLPNNQLITKNLTFGYGDIASGVVAINQEGFERGTIAFGKHLSPSAIVKLPKHSSLNIVGDISNFSLSEWQKVFSHKEKSNESKKKLPYSLLSTLEFHFDNFELFGRTLANVTLSAKYVKQLIQITIKNKEVDGYLIADYQKEVPSINLVFKHILFPPSKTKKPPEEVTKKDTIDPRTLPQLTFQCQNMEIGDIQLGTVSFYTQPTKEGLNVDAFAAKEKTLNLQINGQWKQQNNHQHARIQANLSGHNVNQLLQHLGYPKSPLTGDDIQAILDAGWPGGLHSVSLKDLEGVLNLLVVNGRIVDVEPGVGRVLGLFDLQILPRRLTLDFMDVFGKGFEFETITGSFSIREGNAHTNNLILQGPAAHIEITGRTGLVTKDYDQIVTVIPHVSNALPIAGALAGGLGIGAIALFAQKLLETEIEKLINYKYRIVGSWDKPQIVPIVQKDSSLFKQ